MMINYQGEDFTETQFYGREIIYMKDGTITERGTFRELMELGGNFAHIYRVQQEQAADEVHLE